jgi:hypothetical protein
MRNKTTTNMYIPGNADLDDDDDDTYYSIIPDRSHAIRERWKYAFRRTCFYVFLGTVFGGAVAYPFIITNLTVWFWIIYLLWFELDVTVPKNAVSYYAYIPLVYFFESCVILVHVLHGLAFNGSFLICILATLLMFVFNPNFIAERAKKEDHSVVSFFSSPIFTSHPRYSHHCIGFKILFLFTFTIHIHDSPDVLIHYCFLFSSLFCLPILFILPFSYSLYYSLYYLYSSSLILLLFILLPLFFLFFSLFSLFFILIFILPFLYSSFPLFFPLFFPLLFPLLFSLFSLLFSLLFFIYYSLFIILYLLFFITLYYSLLLFITLYYSLLLFITFS